MCVIYELKNDISATTTTITWSNCLVVLMDVKGRWDVCIGLIENCACIGEKLI